MVFWQAVNAILTPEGPHIHRATEPRHALTDHLSEPLRKHCLVKHVSSVYRPTTHLIEKLLITSKAGAILNKLFSVAIEIPAQPMFDDFHLTSVGWG